MKKAVIYIVILGISCTALGVAIGIGAEKRYTARHFPQIVKSRLAKHIQGSPMRDRKLKDRKSNTMRRAGHHALKRLSQQIDLSEEQNAEVKAILEESRQDAKKTSDKFKSRLKQIREESNVKISKILNPEQQEKFEQLSNRAKRRRHERFEEKQPPLKGQGNPR
ncbi:MAG: hypothetical protein U9R31_01765 [Candidatus Omnitrophota bacterium]|nr:hypothetical protein [Candidatus Omnitrophota bacterium]